MNLSDYTIIKKDGTLEPFNPEKIVNAVTKSSNRVMVNLSEEKKWDIVREVEEAIEALKGRGPSDLMEVCYSSGSTMLTQAKICQTKAEARLLLQSKIESGEAFEVFKNFVAAQGGDVSFIENPDLFMEAMYSYDVVSTKSGYVSKADAITLGTAAMRLGAGREKKEDIIDQASGIVLNKKIGDEVKKGEVLATLYTDRPSFDMIVKDIYSAFEVSDSKVEPLKVVLEEIE